GRTADLRRRGRSLWARSQLLLLLGAQSCRRGTGLFHHPHHHADPSGGRGFAHAARSLVEAFTQSAIAGELWDWILHLIRLYRYLYLRELCACTRTASARPYG